MWVVEVASPKNRQIVSGLVMTSVPFTAVIVCWIVLGVFESESNWGWRSAVLGEAVGPIFGTLLLLFVDESPRWLIRKGQPAKVGTSSTLAYFSMRGLLTFIGARDHRSPTWTW